MKCNKVDLVKDEVSEVIINTKNILVDFGERKKLSRLNCLKLQRLKNSLIM